MTEEELNSIDVESGTSEPLGSRWDGQGVNFSIYSESARRIELCLFSEDNEVRRINLTRDDNNFWHCYIRGLGPGALYGYRVHGLYEPHTGLRFNHNKLLLDPYAKAISEGVCLSTVHYDYLRHDRSAPDKRDSARDMPKCIVVDESFDWEGDERPDVPWNDTIIYELHIKGFTILNSDVKEEFRGTYKGLSSPDVIEYLKSLGITAVELMPVHHSVSEKRLRDNGLSNYWGYNTIGFFAPDARYAAYGAGDQVSEFKSMVKALHNAGIEVILDVVYNHTAEGGADGPSLSFRGIDNKTYYRLNSHDQGQYVNLTGTGNTTNTTHPAVQRLILDSLRYWVEQMHVDGFRFDLAASLGRGDHDFTKFHPLLERISIEPVFSGIKLIAEPWDIGPGGYQVGNFPDPFSEWNDKYRNTIRKLWKSESSQAADAAYRLSGSSDLYGLRSKGSHSSINYICSHDGFTLQDLVSYNQKHNRANLENNRDGTSGNFSYNFGEEGETNNQEILRQREKQKRNFLATLFLSKGTPMLLSGDECGRTQKGNNNAYCQDNEISWFNWNWRKANWDLFDFTRDLIELRSEYPQIKKGSFFNGHVIYGSDVKDLTWYMTDGTEFRDYDWRNHDIRSFSYVMVNETNTSSSENRFDGALMIFINASPEDIEFTVPAENVSSNWILVMDTSRGFNETGSETYAAGSKYRMTERSLGIFKPSTEY